MLNLSDIQAAHTRIAPYVRRTPLLAARPLKSGLSGDWSLFLKLENLQITGSFKARGAINKLLTLEETTGEVPGLVTASGGNHGLGVAYAGWMRSKPATIFLPESTPPIKAQKIATWGAEVIYQGQVWDEANLAALELAERRGLAYFHPFADPVVIAGQGTIGLEIMEDAPGLDSLLVAIGGGGLMAGVALAVKAINPAVRLIGIEPTGAPTLYESLKAGKPVELDAIRTGVGTLAPRMSSQVNFDIIRQHVSEIVLVSDEEMAAAQQWLWVELGIASELAGTAAIAALLTGKVRPGPGERVGVVICAANADIRF
ncbi:MAG: Serine/threonine dehydratase [Chloroflexi bacterium]|jgi:threonine dehydratase|nr:Serine/threonine dehydratase [Chloroflexota bacterium]